MKSALRSVHQYGNAFLRSKQKYSEIQKFSYSPTHSEILSFVSAGMWNILFVYLTQLLSKCAIFSHFFITTKRIKTIPQYFCRHGVFQHFSDSSTVRTFSSSKSSSHEFRSNFPQLLFSPCRGNARFSSRLRRVENRIQYIKQTPK